MKNKKSALLSHNACFVTSHEASLKSIDRTPPKRPINYSVFPDSLKSQISSLRVWGVYSPVVGDVVFVSASRNDCVRYLKTTSKVLAGYVVRFDSAY